MKSTLSYLFSFFLFLSCGNENSSSSNSCLPSLPIRTTSSQGGFTTVALTDNGEIWQWIVGRGEEVQIQSIPIKDVCSIGMYRPHGMTLTGLALQKNGKVQVWNINTMDMIQEMPLEKKVKKIEGGLFHAVVLFSDGTVGGLGNEIGFSGFKSLKDVVDVAAGNDYSIACTKDGKVYVTGQNSGNYIAYDSESSTIEDAFKIPGLENIVKVGTNEQQHHYAVDNTGHLYYWDTQTHIKKASFLKAPEKARAILKNGFYLNEELKAKWRPEYQNNKEAGVYLDYESDPKLKGALDVYQFRNYALALKGDGSVFMYDLQEYRSGKFIGQRIVGEQPIPDLRVDLSYYQ